MNFKRLYIKNNSLRSATKVLDNRLYYFKCKSYKVQCLYIFKIYDFGFGCFSHPRLFEKFKKNWISKCENFKHNFLYLNVFEWKYYQLQS
jgi:hypothetical protein